MPRYVLGLSALYHDSAAALLADGAVVAAASEERFSRIKHDAALPIQAARWCMEQAGIESGDLEATVYYEKPLRRFERQVVSQVLNFPRSFQAFRRSAASVLSERLWVGSAIVKALEISSDKLLFSEHHLSHAASAFYCSPFEEAAILTVDGVGEWASTGLWKGDGQGIHSLGELHFPHSLGLIYSAFTAFLGFRVNNGEYKVMGMAAYGEPRFEAEVRRVLRSVEPVGFEVDLDAVSYHYSATESYTRRFEELFGAPRFPGSPFVPGSEEGRRMADIAASVQKVTEDELVRLAEYVHAQTGATRLCMAGGVALNSVANRHILERGPFDELYVQPAAGDAGGALGAALWVWHEVLGQPRRPEPVLPSAGLGKRWGSAWVSELLADLRIPHEVLGPDELAERAAEDLAQGRVIGWFQGGFEWGPRALGFRSILADPRGEHMQERVNARIKFRESFRPFAPAALEEQAGRYFQLPKGGEQPLRWMLMVAPTTEEGADTLKATTHVDGSARVQVVQEEANPRYHALIKAFGERTGTPVVLNTSFNLKGEPIVGSPVHALATFQRSGLDALYLGRHRIQKETDGG